MTNLQKKQMLTAALRELSSMNVRGEFQEMISLAAAITEFGQEFIETVPAHIEYFMTRPDYPVSEMQARHIASLMAANQFIPAIKAFREVTHAGLKEAKDIMDFARQRFPAEYRDPHAA